MVDQPELLGWEVVDQPSKNGAEAKKLSRPFTVKSSAETCLQLLRSNGFPNAYLRDITGIEHPGRRAARKGR